MEESLKRVEDIEKRSVNLMKLHEKALQSQKCLEQTIENFQNQMSEMMNTAVKAAMDQAFDRLIFSQKVPKRVTM